MPSSYDTKSLYESLCSLRLRVDCFSEFADLVPDSAQYQSAIQAFSLIISESVEALESEIQSLHLSIKREEEDAHE